MTELQPGKILELDAARVKPFAGQPRKCFRGIKQLAESIRLIGQVTKALCDVLATFSDVLDNLDAATNAKA